MAKVCAACGKTISAWASRGKVADGYVHFKCWHNANVGLNVVDYGRLYTGAAIMGRIAARNGNSELTTNNRRVRHIGLLSFDDNTQTFTIIKKGREKAIYHYNQIVNFELLENDKTVTITQGGLGRAVVGGILFGGVGAVVGATTASRKSMSVCKSLKIKVALRNSHNLVEYIHFIDTETAPDSSFYQNRYETAQETMSALQLAVEQVENDVVTSSEQVASGADEILKFKQLLDTGAITQEEFDAKKKQLLGL